MTDRNGTPRKAAECAAMTSPASSATQAAGPGGEHSPVRSENLFKLCRTGWRFPYPDTELQSRARRLTLPSASACRAGRRKRAAYPAVHSASPAMIAVRSEERRVGKEWRARWSAEHIEERESE